MSFPSGTPTQGIAPARSRAEQAALTVSALTAQVKSLLEGTFNSVWVVGEVTSVSLPKSGHVYFKLKDEQACLSAVMWRTTALRHRYAIADGQQIIARGRITVYPPRGEYQFSVDEMHAKGAGAQDLALQRLKEKLQKLGYFASERKRPLPRFPARIAIVASPTGAAVRDILEILGRRWPAVEVWVRGVRVQGDGAAAEIALALQHLNSCRDIDVVILGRGGGSSDDLASFNDERVAHAIFTSRIPVISAVGHEVDVTLADHVADVRALTPSDAAILSTPDREELKEHLRVRARRLHNLLLARYQASRQYLASLADRRVFQLPLERLRELERRLDAWDERLERSMKVRLQRSRHAVEARAAQLASLSPLNVLGRGYSLMRVPETRELIRSVDQVQPGTAIEVVTHDGQVRARVESVERDPTVAPPSNHHSDPV